MSPPRLLPLLPALLLLSTADDSAPMSKLLASLSTPPPGWSSSDPFCSWTNVQCDSTRSFVISIDLNSAGVSGSLPPELNQLSQLRNLAVKKNSLSGTLPSFENMTSLQTIYLNENSFTRVPDNFLLGLTALETFNIGKNQHLAPWQIPAYLTQSTQLASFSATNARITGIIPDFFGSFPKLLSLKLSHNLLTGSLPESFSGSGIQVLWLNNQNLTGKIEVWASMTQLSQVWLHANGFTGGIPDLSKCTNLFDLQLGDNYLTGVVPPSLLNLPKLINITLQNNKLQGPYPQFPDKVKATIEDTNSFCLDKPGPCDPQVTALLDVAGGLGYPMSLAESWKGNDACQDWSFINCDSQRRNVTTVNLGKQGFSGFMSPAFANLTSLRILKLNDNNLTGVIPNELVTLPQLQTLDVSNNNLSGPNLDFRPAVNFVSGGNPLLGKNISGTNGGGGGSGGDSGNGGGSGSSSRRGSGSAAIIAGVVVAVAVFVGGVLFVSYKCYVKRRQKRFGRVEGSGIQNQSKIPVCKGGNVAISIQVLRQATGNFSRENMLGRGRFGVVYNGEMHDGTKIAVKRMETSAMGTQGMREFQAVIAVLSKVRHRHVVALLGYCINDNERLLVYEYMPQGTLGQHLFKWKEHSLNPLTWKQRVIIALDVARGVQYLHSLTQQSFIHRDLKPSNILLLDDMRAKIADLGLVKKVQDGKHALGTQLAGTLGYLAPEYAATGKLTTKVDVYAFGVVLMEIITGRKVLDETLPEERSPLVTWFRRVVINKDDLRKSTVDPILNPDDETFKSICKVATLACHCTASEPSQRPDMGYAVRVLGPLVQLWKPSEPEELDNYGINHPQLLPRWLVNLGNSRRSNDLSLTLPR